MSTIDASYELQLTDINDLDSLTYQVDVANIFREYYAAKVAAGEVDTSTDVVINPQFIHNGVRTLAKVGSFLGKLYLRHKALIDPFLDAALVAAFTTIGNRADEIKQLNNRGPT